jgi:glutamate--glyoxylate aminotransferase
VDAIKHLGRDDAQDFLMSHLAPHSGPHSTAAIVAINILNIDLCRQKGQKPSFTLGHAVGEIVAAYAAGMLSVAEAIEAAHAMDQDAAQTRGGNIQAEQLNLSREPNRDHFGESRNFTLKQVLLPETLNQGAQDMRYDVRGEIYHAAQKRLSDGKEVIFTNVGNPHQMGEKPLTYPRQVVALCSWPDMLKDQQIVSQFPRDAIQRANHYLGRMKGGIGAYSDSRGHVCIRDEVAGFITRRDAPAPPASEEGIFITNGAGSGVTMFLHTIIRDSDDCVLAPVPQYPLYSACVARFGGTLLGYYLSEDSTWSLDMSSLQNTVFEARRCGKRVRVLILINPGNPTGSILDRRQLENVLKFAGDQGIAVVADEVYQENVYAPEDKPFVSCRSALFSLGEPYWSGVELISFHSVSKGAFGECGWRGGYFQLMNVDSRTHDLLYKVASVQLSPSVPSQVILGIMCNPPKFGEESYASYQKERRSIIDSLKRRATKLVSTFNSLPGVSCSCPDGAMYAFPRIVFSEVAVAAAKSKGKSPDVFYALRLLDETGICVVPGSGFGQAEGSFHIRTTFLAPEEQMPELQQKFIDFHLRFLAEFGVPDEFEPSAISKL